MQRKRFTAIVMAATMVLSSSVMANAAETSESYNATTQTALAESESASVLSVMADFEENTESTGETLEESADEGSVSLNAYENSEPSDEDSEIAGAEISEENTGEEEDAGEEDEKDEVAGEDEEEEDTGEDEEEDAGEDEEDSEDEDAEEDEEEDGIMTLSYKEYHKDYNYGTLNFTSSSDGYSADDIMNAAVNYIVANEGDYTTVLKSDVGKGTSIGKIGWHAENALLLLQLIVSEGGEDAYNILSYNGKDDTFYNEITDDSTTWSDNRPAGYRILTDDEADRVEELLGTSYGISVQDKLAQSYVKSYLNNGWALGLRKGAVLVDYADMENQYGYYQTTNASGTPVGGSQLCVQYAVNIAGSAANVTLNDLHIAGVIYVATNEIYTARGDYYLAAYIERRWTVYNGLVAAGWPYGSSKLSNSAGIYSTTKSFYDTYYIPMIQGGANIEKLNGTWTYTVYGSPDYSYTGLAENSNGWYYVKNGIVDFTYNGFASNSDGLWYVENSRITFSKNSVIKDTEGAIGTKGTWYYVVGSKVQTSFTGLANYKNSNGWWYIKNGVVDFTAEGVYKNNNGWWYVTGGKVDFSYNGFASNSNGKWYIEDGKVRFDKNSVVKDTVGAIGTKGTWYYVVGSKVQTSFTGLANYKNSNGWWYIKNGVVDFTAEGVYKNNNGWYYVTGGKVDFSYNGFAANENGSWYIEGGKVRFDKNSVIKDTAGAIGTKGTWYYVVGSKVKTSFTGLANYKNSNGWWYIKDGVVDFTAEGVYKNKNGWYYVTGGKVDFSYNGFAANENGSWYIEGGKVRFDKNSVVKDTTGALSTKGTWYYVVGSKVQYDFTGLAHYRNPYGWWYIKDGVVDFTFNGIAKNQNGWWYIRDGKVDFSFTGTVTAGGIKYTVTGGKVDK